MFRYILLVSTVFILSACQSLQFGSISSDETPAKLTEEPQKIVTVDPAITARLAQEKADLSDFCADSLQTDTQAYSDVWQRVKSQFTFDIPDNRRVASQKNWYLKHPSYMERVTKRATPYIFFIVEELEKNNLPLELALLPIVESAFDPFAYSHGRASGMWQFIPGTGKSFGLKQNWWYDGRRDVYHSTLAAMKFLKYLHKRFDGNWLYALAAYNSGEGNVRKAIRRNKNNNRPVDFWNLKLPKETKAYVPKLLALADLLKNSDNYQLTWTPIDNLPYFDKVDTESQIDLSLAAALADLSMDEFYQLNPAYNHWATSPKGPHNIVLPIENISTFKDNLKIIPKDQRISYKKYTIKNGDSLIKIAQ